LIKSEVDFASSHGTMPPSSGGVFAFEAICIESWVKKVLHKYVLCQPNAQANKSLVLTAQAAFNLGLTQLSV
jgi:hypothetical protein